MATGSDRPNTPVMPSSVPGKTTPRENELISPITESNKSSQTPQAAAQNVPQGRAPASGAGLVSGSGSGAKRLMNGKIGGRYGRGR